MSQTNTAASSSQESVAHSTFCIERIYPHPPSITEQGAFFDGVDSAQGREEGCRGLLESLADELRRSE